MSDIVERLRKGIDWTGPEETGQTENYMDEAADTIATLTARVEELEGALAKMQRSRDRYRQAWEAEKVASAAITNGESK